MDKFLFLEISFVSPLKDSTSDIHIHLLKNTFIELTSI